MLPIALDLSQRPVVLVGRGAGALRRLRLLDEAGARAVTVFSDRPEPALVAAAGARLRRGLPDAAQFAGAAAVLVADLPAERAAPLVAHAHAHGVLTNVEDQRALCDFHMPAIVRRGDLVLAISTGGRAPGLAGVLREWLEALLDAEWGARLRALGEHRRRWRAAGFSSADIRVLMRDMAARTVRLATRDRAA
jgi:precorrin-2 dehydrogenase/sirohydrochlorin ferrochelatase